MTNLYCDLSTFKARMGISGTSDDAALLTLLEHVSRAIDTHCNRFFYVKTETRYYDGCRSPLALDQDLAAVTALATDDNGDGAAWETAWAATDYELLPLNGSPKSAIAVTPWGKKADFLPGQRKALQVAGRWGYEETTEDSGADINEGGAFSSSDATLTVTDGTKFKTGQTIKIESEQLYISAISGNNLTVKRGVNGTAAASHADASDIMIVRYPAPVVEACLALAGRAWRRKDLQFVVSPLERPGAGPGPLAEVDPEARSLLAPYRRVAFGAV